MPIAKLQNAFATTISYPIYNPPTNPTIPTISFTAAQLTAFWTSPAQMGIPYRTRTQMALEGLVGPAVFEDFAKAKINLTKIGILTKILSLKTNIESLVS